MLSFSFSKCISEMDENNYQLWQCPRYIVVVAVKECKSNSNMNEKEVIKIIAEYKRSK
jgi:hypothetical protein